MPTKDKLVQRVIDRIAKRSDKGIKKFGNTMGESKKPTIAWINDAQEELADAIIYPDSGIVTVAKQAIIETLYGAKIVADDLTEYHTFINATVDLKSAHNYFKVLLHGDKWVLQMSICCAVIKLSLAQVNYNCWFFAVLENVLHSIIISGHVVMFTFSA